MMKRKWLFYLVLAAALIAFPITIFGLGGYYQNSADFYDNGNTEYYVNYNDLCKLYKLDMTDNSEQQVLSKPIISMVSDGGNILYMISCENEKCELIAFNMYSCEYKSLLNFDYFVNSIAIRNNEIFIGTNGGIVAYNTETSKLSKLIRNGNVSLFYFTGYNSLKYYETNGDNNKVINCSCEDTQSGTVVKEKESSILKAHSSDEVIFTPRLTEPLSDNLYYKNVEYGGLNECIVISNGMVIPNCVGYAWGRAYEILGLRPNLCKSNAGKWFDYNKNGGYYGYGSKPYLGAIAVWKKNNVTNGWGHVAVVEEINGDEIITSESGYKSFTFKTCKRDIKDPNFSFSKNYTFLGFIYVMGQLSTEDVAKTANNTGNGTQHIHDFHLRYEAEHPHKAYMECSCGITYYTGETGAYLWYESEHPHKEYYECVVDNCSMNHKYTGNCKIAYGYEAEHPHKEYCECLISGCNQNHSYTGREITFFGYEAEHPHRQYNVCGVSNCIKNHQYTGKLGSGIWYEADFPHREYYECIIDNCELHHKYNGKMRTEN